MYELPLRIPAIVMFGMTCALSPATGAAYSTWSGGCDDCHGDFYLANYTSQVDGTNWGTSLMFGHLGFMGNDTCSVCHQPTTGLPRFPVYLGISAGISGYSPIGCLGCHGRPGDATGSCVTGSTSTINPANCGMGRGLRRHHANSGVTACAGCHTDGTGRVASESARPTFYFTPDTAHPNKPTNACNLAAAPRNENKFGLAGLDNDGDILYDSADTDCVDNDGDGILNGSDNCTFVANPNQLDANLDGFGNLCDADVNNSGTTTATDFNLLRNCLNLSAGSGATCAASDMNGSGTVTATDFNLLRARLNQAPGPSGLHCADATAPFSPCPSQ